MNGEIVTHFISRSAQKSTIYFNFLSVDVHGNTSPTLELLRQSISKGEVLSFDANHLKSLNSGTISYLATCCLFGLGNHHSNVISPRLSRLFSIFVLPNLSMDVILSMYSPRLKDWLKDVPFTQRTEDIAICIITATKNLYNAICGIFLPTQQRPHFVFSHHDLQKVFGGLQLWQPNSQSLGTLNNEDDTFLRFSSFLSKPGAALLNVVHLWMHECMRTFSDRLCSDDERQALVSLITKTATTHYKSRLFDGIQNDGAPEESPALDPPIKDGTPEPGKQRLDHNSLNESLPSYDTSKDSSEISQLLQDLFNSHMEDMVEKLVFGPEVSAAKTSAHHQPGFRLDFLYKNHHDLSLLQQELRALIQSKDGSRSDEITNITTKCFIHTQRVVQLMHIMRALLIPDGHGVLLAAHKDTGRKTTVRLAAFLTDYVLMEVHPGNEDKLQEILREARNHTRADQGNVIILVHEGISQTVREELLVAMAHRTYPGLYGEEHLTNLLSRLTAGKNSKRYLMDNWSFMR